MLCAPVAKVGFFIPFRVFAVSPPLAFVLLAGTRRHYFSFYSVINLQSSSIFQNELQAQDKDSLAPQDYYG